MSSLTKEQQEELQRQLLEFMTYLLNPTNGFFGATNIKTLINGLTDLNNSLPQMTKLVPTQDEQSEIAKSIANEVKSLIVNDQKFIETLKEKLL